MKAGLGLSLAGAAISIIFVATKVLSRQIRVCRDKIMFVATKLCLSRQNYVCCDKHTFVATKDVFCLSKCVCRVMGVCGRFHRTLGFKGLKELLFGKKWYFPREVVFCLLER